MWSKVAGPWIRGTPMARGPASSRSGTPVHLGLRSRRWNVPPVAGWPGSRPPARSALDQRPRPRRRPVSGAGTRCLVSTSPSSKMVNGPSLSASRTAARVGPVRRVEPVVLHPARQLPLPPGRSEREVDAAVLGREVVHRPAERERLDHRPVRQRLRKLAGPRPRTAGPHGELGEGLIHRQHRTEPAYDVGHRLGPDRVEQVSPNRQASAWLQVTEKSVEVVMPTASHRFRTIGVL